MNKFLKVMLIILSIFIGVLIIRFTMDFTNSKETNEIEESKIQMSPEEMQTQTVISITNIILKQLLENVILNIDVTQHGDKQDVILYLQSNEFVTEDTLLKDSYNILNEIHKIKNIRNFTFKWYMLVKNNNTEVLTLSFSQETISKIKTLSYDELTPLATHYEKHGALK